MKVLKGFGASTSREWLDNDLAKVISQNFLAASIPLFLLLPYIQYNYFLTPEIDYDFQHRPIQQRLASQNEDWR